VPEACAALIQIGFAVVECATPQQISDEMEEIARRFIPEVRPLIANLNDSLNMAVNRELKSPGKLTKKLAFREGYKWIGKKVFFSSPVPEQINSCINKRTSQLSKKQFKLRMTLWKCGMKWGQDDWFTGIGKERRRCFSRAKRTFDKCLADIRQQQKNSLQKLREQSFAKLPEWWKETRRDRIGRKWGNSDVLQLGLTLSIIVPLTLVLLHFLGGIGMIWIGPAILVYGLSVLTAFRKMKKWHELSIAVRKKKRYSCPNCGTKARYWIGREQNDINCPRCGTAMKPGTVKSRRTGRIPVG
jgi:ribosomal protein L37AE/L43A